MTPLQEKLAWRYATKKMDPARAVPAETLERILEAIRMAPTSSGLQPFEVVVVANPALRAEMAKAANGQQQLVDGSHVLVFAAWDNYTAERIDAVAAQNVAERGPNPGLAQYFESLKAAYLPRPAQANFEHAARQAYIGLGLAVTAAAFEEVDATPMEGFDPAAMDAVLGLADRGLRSVAILPLGYRDASGDWLVNMKKVRRPAEDFFIRMD